MALGSAEANAIRHRREEKLVCKQFLPAQNRTFVSVNSEAKRELTTCEQGIATIDVVKTRLKSADSDLASLFDLHKVREKEEKRIKEGREKRGRNIIKQSEKRKTEGKEDRVLHAGSSLNTSK